jgi:hypothetical protein
MQTFLPYPNFYKSARVLDPARRRNQRNEGLIIARTLTGWYLSRDMTGWPHHPATKMWQGHEAYLFRYVVAFCHVSNAKGELGDVIPHVRELRRSFKGKSTKPPWLGNEEFHRSHRSNLLRKDPDYYRQFFDEPDDLPYCWPSSCVG